MPKVLAVILAAMLWAMPEVANANVQVSPVIIEMRQGQMATTVFVRNIGSEKSTIQVRTLEWKQVVGEDVLMPTPDLKISPPIFEVKPREQQIIRVVYTGVPTLSQEKSFRLLIDELPIKDANISVQLPIRLSLPVFVGMRPDTQPAVDWVFERISPSKIKLIANNKGTRYARFSNLTLNTREKKQLAKVNGLAGYVLVNQIRDWTFNIPSSEQFKSLNLTVLTDTGLVNTTINAKTH